MVKKLTETNIVFCGTVRDCAKNLARNISCISSIENKFQNVYYALIENDSRDSTKEVLRKLKRENSKAFIKIFDDNTTTVPKKMESGINPSFSEHRISKMIRYRNMYLDLIENEIGYDNLDYVCMIDWDLNRINPQDILKGLLKSDSWDVLCANGRQKIGLTRNVYYDLYALELKNESYPLSEAQIFSKRETIQSNLDRGQPVEVNSCFCGLGLYHASQLKGLYYKIVKNDNERVEVLCEHVSLHRELIQKGHSRIQIDPDMVVIYNTRFTALCRLAKKVIKKTIFK